MDFRKLFTKQENVDLTEGSIGEKLLYLTAPLILINLMRTGYNLVDTFWLGQLSKNALAAITFAFPLIFFFVSLGLGIAIAGSVLVAQNKGKGNQDRLNFAASQTMVFAFIASILMGVFSYFTVEAVLGLLGAKPAVQELGTKYMKIISFGIFNIFGFSVFISLLRGYGNTHTPMKIMAGSVAVNLVLDPLLIFGWSIFPAMGIEGAAIATVFSRGLGLIAGLYILYTGREGVKIDIPDLRPQYSFLKKVVKIGVPASGESVGTSVSVNLLTAVVGIFSTAVVSGFGIGIRVFAMLILPAVAMSRGVETMVGQNLGAGKGERARKTSIIGARYAFIILTLIGIGVFFGSEAIASIFSKDQVVIENGSTFLKFFGPIMGFIGIYQGFKGGFRGAGKTGWAAIASILLVGVFRVPTAWILSQSYGPTGIWASIPISVLLGVVVTYLMFRRMDWNQSLV